MKSRWSKLPHFLADFPKGARNKANRWALLGALAYLAKTQPTVETEVTPDGQSHKVYLEPGQVLVSLNELARLLGMSRSTVQGLLRQLHACMPHTATNTGSEGKRIQGRRVITLYKPESLAGYEKQTNTASNTGSPCTSNTLFRDKKEIENPLPKKRLGLLPPPEGSELLVEACQKVWSRAHELEPKHNPEPDWFDLGTWWLSKVEASNGSIDWTDELERFEIHWTVEAIHNEFKKAKRKRKAPQFRLKGRLLTWLRMAEKRATQGGSNGKHRKAGPGGPNKVAVRGKRWK